MLEYNEIRFETDGDTVSELPKVLKPIRRGLSNTPTTMASPRNGSRMRFSNNQEIFIDSVSPLILITDTNSIALTPRSTAGLQGSITSRIRDLNDRESPNKKIMIPKFYRNSILSVESELTTPGKSTAILNDSNARKTPFEFNQTPRANVDIFQQNFKKQIEEKKPNYMKISLTRMLDSTSYNIFMMVTVLVALFGDDIRTAALEASSDLAVDVVLLLTMFFFTIEILISLWVRDAYLWSFFFWLDLVSTISIICDVNFISSDIFPQGTTNTAQLARASRASRIGARAGRVARLFRLTRLVKVYKQVNKPDQLQTKQEVALRRIAPEFGEPIPTLKSQSSFEEDDIHEKGPRSGTLKDIPSHRPSLFYRSQQNVGSKKQSMRELAPLTRSASVRDQRILNYLSTSKKIQIETNEEDLKESRVGKKLSDLTTKRVIVIVLALLMLIPLFTSDFYFDSPVSEDYEAQLLNRILNDPSVATETKEAFIKFHIVQEANARPDLVYLSISDQTYYSANDSPKAQFMEPINLRADEKDVVQFSGPIYGALFAVTSSRSRVVLESILNIVRTLFVCFMLTVASLMFTRDINTLILRPIERMIDKVNQIARNPLIAKEQGMVKESNNNETIQIENAIIKIGGLLALGFGDAGSTIIAQNLTISGDINPMLPGVKQLAIFGFCDIRNFTNVTEVLEEEVMVFVNSIAEIVHSTVDLYTGAANKNIGDAFLLAWKFPETEVVEKDDGTLVLKESRTVESMTDFALISFIKINIALNRDPDILEYRSNLKINAILPNYKVKMGFGLHVGWAIEGAIGSEFKIDASYLSPNVNIASRLEAATKQYGVPLLFSGELYRNLSDDLKQKTRLIDIITVKGSVTPLEIYTVDMDLEGYEPIISKKQISKDQKRELQKIKKENIWEDMREMGSSYLMQSDREIVHAFRNHSAEFRSLFEAGFEAYIDGEWNTARNKFEKGLTIYEDDGPSKSLLEFMKSYRYLSPEDWPGYRVLTEK